MSMDILPFYGETRIFPYDFAPEGWMTCDGQLLPIKGNEILGSVIGITYGGDGKTNFALPKVVGPKSQGTPLKVCISLQGQIPKA
jgi:microcystin-dependent protein